MGLFRRKSKWDRLMESAAAVAEGGSVRQAAKVRQRTEAYGGRLEAYSSRARSGHRSSG